MNPNTIPLTSPEPASAEVGAQFNRHSFNESEVAERFAYLITDHLEEYNGWNFESLIPFLKSAMAESTATLRAELAAVKAELAKAKEDSELLDWLEANIIGTMGEARANEDEHPMHVWLFSAPAYEPEQGGLCQAIRSAIAASKENKL